MIVMLVVLLIPGMMPLKSSGVLIRRSIFSSPSQNKSFFMLKGNGFLLSSSAKVMSVRGAEKSIAVDSIISQHDTETKKQAKLKGIYTCKYPQP